MAAEHENKEEDDEEGVTHRPKKQRRWRIIDDDDDDSEEEQGLSDTPAVSTLLAPAMVAWEDAPAVVDLTLDSDDDE